MLRPGMHIALACYNDRLAALLETAEQFRTYELNRGRLTPMAVIDLPQGPASVRVRAMAAAGVEALVCGALSRGDQMLLDQAGLRVLAWHCGEVDAVTRALEQDRLDELRMPGCCGRRWGGRGPEQNRGQGQQRGAGQGACRRGQRQQSSGKRRIK